MGDGRNHSNPAHAPILVAPALDMSALARQSKLACIGSLPAYRFQHAGNPHADHPNYRLRALSFQAKVRSLRSDVPLPPPAQAAPGRHNVIAQAPRVRFAPGLGIRDA